MQQVVPAFVRDAEALSVGVMALVYKYARLVVFHHEKR